jgi:hypothetical protein
MGKKEKNDCCLYGFLILDLSKLKFSRLEILSQ